MSRIRMRISSKPSVQNGSSSIKHGTGLKQDLVERYNQLNPTKHKEKRKYSSKPAWIGADTAHPTFTDAFEEETGKTDEIDLESKFLEDDQPDPDESPDYDNMDGDEDEGSLDYNYESTNKPVFLVTLRHKPCAEINEVNGKLFASFGHIHGSEKQRIIRSIVEKITIKSYSYILNESSHYNKLEQAKLAKELKTDKHSFNRIINNQYIAFPNGVIYPLSMFFSDASSVKVRNREEIYEFLNGILQKEKAEVERFKKEGRPINKEFLYSDEKIAEEYLKEFKSENQSTKLESVRRKVQRYRNQFGIKAVEDRLLDYKK